MSILKYLYPVPREDSKRILTFANHDDYISFRHHTYKKVTINDELNQLFKLIFCFLKYEVKHVPKFYIVSLQAENGKDIDLAEVGPRFQLRLYEIKLGTLESSSAADTEWALRPYMNTAKKRRFLSDEDGFEEEL